MATNIIDAFLVTFGLDVRDYKKGERDLRDGNKRLLEDSKSTFDQVEGHVKKSGQAFRGLANEAAGLFLVLAGASSIKDFASNLVHGESSAGRLSETLGISTQRLWAWQEAVKQVGGKEGDASGALQRIATAIQSYELTGTTGMDADLRGLGITNSDIMSKDPSEILLKMAAAGERLGKPEFAARLQRIEIPQSTIYLLEQGRGKLEALLKTTEQHAGITETDVQAAQDFERAMATMSTAIKGLALPALTSIVNGMNFFLTDSNGVADGIIHISDAFEIMGISAKVAYDHWRAGVAARMGDKAGEAQWNAYAEQNQQKIRDIYGKRAGASGGDSGVDGNSSTGDIRKVFPGYQPPRARAGGGVVASTATDSYIQNYLKRSGFTEEQSRGIWAGIRAEGGSLGMAKNGAFGIGQWRGGRAKNLFRQYGRAPTLQQQMAFLVSELRGGDHGGPAVGRQLTADHTLLAYITQFMRPGAGTLGDVRRGRNYLAGRGGGTTNIGTIIIQTKATDARGIARDLGGELRNRSLVAQADAGVAP